LIFSSLICIFNTPFLLLFKFDSGLFMDPPETADHVRYRVVSAIAKGIKFPSLSNVAPHLWGQLPSALASEIAAQYASSFGLEPTANIAVSGMCLDCQASRFPEWIIADLDNPTKPEKTTVQNAIKMIIDSGSSHRRLDIISSTLSAASPANDVYR
jgi:hypothetical protein